MNRAHTSLIAVSLLTLLAAVGTASETIINIAPHSDVRGPNVLLRDLVGPQSDLPEAWHTRPVLSSPEPGKSRNIPISSIAYALQQYPDMHHVVLRGTSQTRVRRTETAMDGETIALAVKRYVEENPPWKDEQVDITCNPPARQTRLPEGNAGVRVLNCRADLRGAHQYVFDVAIEVDGVAVRNIEVQAKILPMREVWVAATSLSAGHILTANDLVAQTMPAAVQGTGRMSAIESLVGLEVARSIKPGQPILSQHVLPRLCATRGDTISVSASSAGITVTLAARALSSGRLGDVITCENFSSKRRITVRLTQPKEATTDLSPALEDLP